MGTFGLGRTGREEGSCRRHAPASTRDTARNTHDGCWTGRLGVVKSGAIPARRLKTHLSDPLRQKVLVQLDLLVAVLVVREERREYTIGHGGPRSVDLLLAHVLLERLLARFQELGFRDGAIAVEVERVERRNEFVDLLLLELGIRVLGHAGARAGTHLCVKSPLRQGEERRLSSALRFVLFNRLLK